jgi:hypothetical protein
MDNPNAAVAEMNPQNAISRAKAGEGLNKKQRNARRLMSVHHDPCLAEATPNEPELLDVFIASR